MDSAATGNSRTPQSTQKTPLSTIQKTVSSTCFRIAREAKENLENSPITIRDPKDSAATGNSRTPQST